MNANQQSETQTIANRLVQLCSEGKFMQAHNELFADDAVSIEPPYTGMPPTHGIEAINKRGKEHQETIAENHGGYVNDPIVAGNHFAVTMGMDITTKNGERAKMDEVCVYEVQAGKIISQHFFY